MLFLWLKFCICAQQYVKFHKNGRFNSSMSVLLLL
uniref:Uncharacterized protein n=1 Tax=Anguilla anguilla TaxID=7936 RepID=A0A0E9RSC3_ANGAN